MARKKKKRDYKAEYARRVERAKELGYSKAVARGHAPAGVIGIKRAKKIGLKPGFVLNRRRKGKGFVSSPQTRLENIEALRKAGLDIQITRKDVTERVKEVREHPEEITDQLAYQDYTKKVRRQVTTAEEFAAMLKNFGFSEREAYTLWFS